MPCMFKSWYLSLLSLASFFDGMLFQFGVITPKHVLNYKDFLLFCPVTTQLLPISFELQVALKKYGHV